MSVKPGLGADEITCNFNDYVVVLSLNVLDFLSSEKQPDHMTERRRTSRWKSIALVGLFVVVVLSVGLFARQPLAAALNQATTRQVQPSTALSYINTGHLPTYVKAGIAQPITFRVTNHEAATTVYGYYALLSTGGQVTILEEGKLTVPVGASADHTLTFTLPQPEMDATIIIQLVDRPEYITFGTKS